MERSHQVADEHVPSFFQNSCPGISATEWQKGEVFSEKDGGAVRPNVNIGVNEDEVIEEASTNREGWTRSLKLLPNFDNEKLDNKLIKNSTTMPNTGTAPKAFRNKKHGYRLWKEGYVRGVLVKPNIKASQTLFLVKAKVHASMKSVQYNVYVHLDQCDGEVLFAKCTCKAGQGGCCKHVAALLYTIVDFINMDVKEVPMDLTCTQTGQKWHVPSSTNSQTVKAFKFKDLVFEKAEESKKRKRPFVTGNRDAYCATPSFAQETTSEELEELVSKLRLAGKASLFCESLESNEFKPCTDFETSSKKAIKQRNCQSDDGSVDESGSIKDFMNQLYESVPKECSPVNLNRDVYNAILEKVGITVEESINICCETLTQSEQPIWYLQRSKRITASLFGKVMNRRQNIHPKSLIDEIMHKKQNVRGSMPAALKWGIDNEDVAIKQYMEIINDAEVKKCGLVVSPRWPWLGCSPDGIILKSSIPVGCIEVKCPYSKRDMKLAEASVSDKTFFLKSVEGKLTLKRNHMYFYQCQGVLNILGLSWIDFIAYTPKDIHIERIQVDKNLWQSRMLPELTKFYTAYILPNL